MGPPRGGRIRRPFGHVEILVGANAENTVSTRLFAARRPRRWCADVRQTGPEARCWVREARLHQDEVGAEDARWPGDRLEKRTKRRRSLTGLATAIRATGPKRLSLDPSELGPQCPGGGQRSRSQRALGAAMVARRDWRPRAERPASARRSVPLKRARGRGGPRQSARRFSTGSSSSSRRGSLAKLAWRRDITAIR